MDELYHYGVKGMKWGIRKDRKRTVWEKQSPEDSEDYTQSRILLSKPPSQLSNAELRKLNERLNLEQNYSNLTTSQIQKGKSFVSQVHDEMERTAAKEVSKGLYSLGRGIVVAAGGALASAAVRAMMDPGFRRQAMSTIMSLRG